MNFIDNLHIGVHILWVLVLSFVITNSMVPRIIMTVHYKKLMDQPNERSSHRKRTPTLAGIAFFASLMIVFFFMKNYDFTGISFNLVAALTVLFFLGLKDDLMVLSSSTKVLLQTLAIIFILLRPELLIHGFGGFLGIFEIPIWLSFGLSYFIVLYIINAYNLIDGIDGLAALLGILITGIYAILFFYTGLYFYTLLAITIVGFLLAFLRFNLSDYRKIFMGDTGSMIVGFLIGLLTLRFISLDLSELSHIHILPENLFIVAVAIIFFPVIDVIRVIMIRLLNKKSPFSADRRHLHHVFIDKGLAHQGASFTILISSIIVFILIYSLNRYVSYWILLAIFIVITVLTFYILLILDTDSMARFQRKKIKKYIPDKVYHQEFRIRKSIIIFLKKFFYRDLL